MSVLKIKNFHMLYILQVRYFKCPENIEYIFFSTFKSFELNNAYFLTLMAIEIQRALINPLQAFKFGVSGRLQCQACLSLTTRDHFSFFNMIPCQVHIKNCNQQCI